MDNRFKVSTPPVETPVTTSVAPIERNIKPVLTQQEASALLKDLQKLQSTPVIKTKPFWNDFSVPEKQATITRLESAITSEPNSKFIKEYEQEIKNIQKTLPKESKVVTPKKIQVKPPQVVSNQRYSLSAARVGKSMLYSVIDNKTGNVVKDFATNEMVDAKKKANDLLSFKQSELHVSQAKNQTIAERLAAEKKAFAASTRGSAVTESFISSAPEKPLVYSPTMSDYEKGLYAAQQEKLSKIVKTPVKKIQTVAQKNINNIYKRYSKLIDSEEPDFKKIQELSDKFLKGTGQDISVYDNGVKMTSLNEASTDRFVPENIFDNPNQIYWSRGKGSSALIGKEAMRPGNALDIEIANIEANRTQFNIPKISLDIIRKFGAHLMRNINGTEGHLFGNIIGIDSILNPLGLAHELAHLITREPIYLRRVAGDAKIRIELRRMYMEYYPMAPKDKATVTQDIWIPEGLAEFVRQHLFNPTLISEKYPELSTRILGTGPLSNPALTKMYNELNKMISIYQRLSPLKQSNARITTDINWEKTGLKSIIVGRNGRAYTNGVYSLHPLHILDQMRSDKVASRKINFATDANGVSSELLASMARTQENFGINAFDIEKGNTAYYID